MHPILAIALPVAFIQLAAGLGTAFIYWAVKKEEENHAKKGSH